MRGQIRPGGPAIELHSIDPGLPGTLKTVGHIAQLIRQGAKDFAVRQTAIDILRQRNVRPKDYLAEIKALFEWVQENIRYTKDTFRVELLHSARRMLELRAGDCDDHVVVLGAMLESIGHPVRLVLTGADPRRQRSFSHIYLEVLHLGRWIPLDATMPHSMGWAPRTLVKKTIAIERKPDMTENHDVGGLGAVERVPVWLTGLIRSIRHEAVAPGDARVRSLWELLRQRQLLRRSVWLKAALRRIWSRGLSARPHPRTAHRIVRRLRRWGILPPPRGAANYYRPLSPPRPVRPVYLKPVASLRPAPLQPVRPAQRQPPAMMRPGR